MQIATEPESITRMRELLSYLRGDIARMNPAKKGTTWHTDRVREIASLEAGIAIRLKRMAESN